MTYLRCLSWDEMNHLLEVSLSTSTAYTEANMSCLDLNSH